MHSCNLLFSRVLPQKNTQKSSRGKVPTGWHPLRPLLSGSSSVLISSEDSLLCYGLELSFVSSPMVSSLNGNHFFIYQYQQLKYTQIESKYNIRLVWYVISDHCTDRSINSIITLSSALNIPANTDNSASHVTEMGDLFMEVKWLCLRHDNNFIKATSHTFTYTVFTQNAFNNYNKTCVHPFKHT